MAPVDAFPKSEDEQTKDEKAIGHVFFLALKDPKIMAIIGLLGVGGFREATRQQAKPEYWTKADIRQTIRDEIAPLESGFKAWVKTRPASERSAILQAMADEQDKIKLKRD